MNVIVSRFVGEQSYLPIVPLSKKQGRPGVFTLCCTNNNRQKRKNPIFYYQYFKGGLIFFIGCSGPLKNGLAIPLHIIIIRLHVTVLYEDESGKSQVLPNNEL